MLIRNGHLPVCPLLLNHNCHLSYMPKTQARGKPVHKCVPVRVVYSG